MGSRAVRKAVRKVLTPIGQAQVGVLVRRRRAVVLQPRQKSHKQRLHLLRRALAGGECSRLGAEFVPVLVGAKISARELLVVFL